jgi:LysM repeat protein
MSSIRTYIRNRDSDLVLPAENRVRNLKLPRRVIMTSTTLRITRRGRVVLAALVALPVIAVSLLVTSPGALAESTPVTNNFEYMTVMSGDTLWSIAQLVDPSGDPRDVVAELMTLNQLSSASLTPGQELAIPR